MKYRDSNNKNNYSVNSNLNKNRDNINNKKNSSNSKDGNNNNNNNNNNNKERIIGVVPVVKRLLAFSLVEISISLIVIAIILAALMPVITKRLTASATQRNKISTNCASLFPDASGYCAMCYVNPKRCIICTRTCNGDEFKNVDKCICESCRIKYSDTHCSRCNSQRCLQCDNGYYLDGNNKCVICPKGYYCYQDNSGSGINGDSGTSVKKPCPKGYAAPNEGMSACVACSKSTSTIQGSAAINEGSINCTLCNNGYYASISSQTTSCNICPSGYYCPQGKIIECPKGYANNKEGQTNCTPCVKSTNTITGTYTLLTKQTQCNSCTNGNYASTSAQSQYCNSCPSGYYCPNGKIIQCPTGTYSTGGASSCITCPNGTTSSAGASSCLTCATGCLTCYTTINNCTNCKAGYYKSGSTCKQCASGYYSNANATTCTKCANGYYSQAGASSCTKCSTKFANCKLCNYNKCIECEEGYKLSDDGTKCEKAGCPAKTIKVTTSSGDLCVTQYNMGDAGEFPLTGVTTVATNSYCNGSGACCWKGTASSICDSANGGYSGCSRTVCTHYAAEIVCANLKYDNRTWRLPTADELASFGAYSINKGSSGLMLCDFYSGSGSARCYRHLGACSGASYDSCRPYIVWSGTLNGSSYAYSYTLNEGSWYRNNYNLRGSARSVRCVTELDE